MNVLNLFKYYAPKYEDGDNLSFYSRGEIYFQKPIKFNDPWDCKAPHIIMPGKRSLKNIEVYLAAKKFGPARAKTEWQKRKKRLSHTERNQELKKHFKGALERLRSKIGVFSLSFIPDCELMWSHYAISHSGYMLHFQIDIDQYSADSGFENIDKLIPVIYSDKREVWDLANYYTDSVSHLYNLIRFKSKAWIYECEFRLLNVDKCGFIKTPSNWLKCIVIGINTDRELQDKLKNIGNSLDVPVLSSKMNEKEYKIDIPDLGINGNDGRTRYEEVKDLEIFEFKPRPSLSS